MGSSKLVMFLVLCAVHFLAAMFAAKFIVGLPIGFDPAMILALCMFISGMLINIWEEKTDKTKPYGYVVDGIVYHTEVAAENMARKLLEAGQGEFPVTPVYVQVES